MKFSVDKQRFADRTGFHQGTRFLAERIVTKVVRNAADFASFLFDVTKHGGFARVHGERLFAKNVFAGAEERTGLLKVDVIRRADVDAGNVLIGGKFSEGRVGFFEAERFCCGTAAFGGAEHAPAHVNAKPAERFQMCATDESKPNNGDGMLHNERLPEEVFLTKANRILRR
jgi:hypothetical protein